MGQAPFENFDFFVKVKGPLGQSLFFYLFFFIFFFSQAVRAGSNFQVGQTGLADVIDDVIQLRRGSGYSAWKRVPCGKEAPARVST